VNQAKVTEAFGPGCNVLPRQSTSLALENAWEMELNSNPGNVLEPFLPCGEAISDRGDRELRVLKLKAQYHDLPGAGN